jgi:hypothetical protein
MAPVVQAVAAIIGAIQWSYAYIAATAVGKALIYIGSTILLAKVSAALGPKLPRATSQPIDVEYTDTVAPRRIVYGENKISGLNVLPAIVTGSSGEYLHQVLALVGHEINAISTVYFNDESLTLDGSGNVTSGTYSGKASVRKYTGTSSQTVDSILNSAITEWDTDHRGRGVAYLALRYTFDQEVYRTGKPDVTAIVQGKKCYDPRMDTSPGANPTNAAYAAYTKNPALCLADYLLATYGLNEDASRVDWSAVVTAANICDEDVAIPGPAMQNRYSCNVVLEATTEFESNIKTLTQAMMGACYYSGGKWRMYAGAWASSSFALTENDVIGEVVIQTAQSRKNEGYYNAVRGQFIDKDRNYQPVEFEPILNSTYESEDGERIYTDVSFPTCDNQYEAQRNAIILSRQSRRQKTVSVVCSLAAYKIRPFQTGTVTIAEVGWTNQSVRCIGWKFRPEPAVELVLIEAESTDYSDPSTGTYITPASTAISDPATYAPGSPQSFTATQEIESILLSWQAPSNSVPGILYRVFQYTSSTPFSSATQIYEGADTQLRVPRTDTATRYFWVQSYYGVTGGTSDPTPSGAGLASSGKIATLNGYLTNDATLVQADSSGTVSSYADAVGYFKMFSGPNDVTASTTFASVSTVNCTAEINTADNTPVSGFVSGYYRVTALSADTGQFTMSATYGGETITKVFTVAKAKAGATGVDAISIMLSRTAVQLFGYADGSVPDYASASGYLTVYNGATDVTASATLSAAASSGVTGTINTSTNSPVSGEPKGFYRITNMSSDVGALTFTVLYNSVTYTATFSASKNKVGYEIVGSLPSTNLFEGRMVFLTTDDKLYRYTGSAWTAAVATTDLSGTISDSQIAALSAAKLTGQITETQITDNSITTAKISAGSVTTAKLAANSVVSSKILVTGAGNSITDDVNTQDETAWSSGGAFSIVNDTTSPTGKALQVSTVSETTKSARRFPIDETKNYNARIYAKQVSGTPLSYLLIAFYDAAGNLLVGSSYPTGWAGAVGTYHYFGRVAQVIPSTWTEYSISFGPNETPQIPPGAASLEIGVLANYSGSGTANFTRFIVAEKSSGELIVDGAITATKIATNAVTADKINAGAVTAAKISVTNLSAINADMGNITAGTIVLPSGGFIRSGQTAYNTGTGFYIGNDSGTPRFSFGNPSGKNIRWDGSDLTVNGGIIVTDSVASNAITASASDSPSDVTLTSTNSGVDNTLSTVSITTVTGSKVLVRCDLTFKFTLATGSLINIYKIYRGSTLLVDIPITSLASAGTYRVPLQWLDSPSAATNTYYIKVEPTLGGSTTYIYEDIITVATEFKR